MSLNGLPGYKIQINHVLSEYTDILVTDAPSLRMNLIRHSFGGGLCQNDRALTGNNRVKMKKFNAWLDNNKHK